MDWYKIRTTSFRKNEIEVIPEFVVRKSNDLMIKGAEFYALWDAQQGLWSTDRYLVQQIVDKDIWDAYDKIVNDPTNGDHVTARTMSEYSSKSWSQFGSYVNSLPDNYHWLDQKIAFANDKIKKTDYISKRLPYSLSDAGCPCYDELISTLYSDEERQKLEWAIGSIFANASTDIQKFIVLYGDIGTGKSTVINIIQKLFPGHYTTFKSEQLGSRNHPFATEAFSDNPLVAIEHDGDLSHIERNTVLNSIVSHEPILINEKHRHQYTSKINSMLFIGSNEPVRITGAKSGLIRRLIDISPTGKKVTKRKYDHLYGQIDFELGAIAKKCLDIFNALGKDYYNDYKPIKMIIETDFFYGFMEENYGVFKKQQGTTVKAAYEAYKIYCGANGAEHILQRNKFQTELSAYFEKYLAVTRVDGKQVRSWYANLNESKFDKSLVSGLGGDEDGDDEINDISIDHDDRDTGSNVAEWLKLDKSTSLLDDLLKDCPAQYTRKDSSGNEIPKCKWENCKTVLSAIKTNLVHYIWTPEWLVCIDLDLKDEQGNKSKELNLKAAEMFPPTYAEFSKGGSGLHLYYIYTGDVSKLDKIYAPGIEIKAHIDGWALRRRVSFCNDIPVTTISSGLPTVKDKKMLSTKLINDENHLRNKILKALRKEVHPTTVANMKYIAAVLDEAYDSGMPYDVSDMKKDILAFANNSTNSKDTCLKLYLGLKWSSAVEQNAIPPKGRNMILDCEVAPNLFLICYKFEDEPTIYDLINPTPAQIETLFDDCMITFNGAHYDNHMIYARYLGHSTRQIYDRSHNIINNEDKGQRKNYEFREAKNMSIDIYDYCTKKQSLKKWEVELKMPHEEMDVDWNQDIPEELWPKVIEYCHNDVLATEATWKKTQPDYKSRCILVEIAKAAGADASVYDSTNELTRKIILGENRSAKDEFIYPDLSKEFPGYEFNASGIDRSRYSGKIVSGKSIYKGVDPGEGGRVFSKPGMYRNVVTFDVAAMHPSSLIAENGFGPYTENLKRLLDIRIHIKHKDYAPLKEMYNGALAPYLEDEGEAKQLSTALKLAINSVYGLTSAKFPNAFTDVRNIDNWVAKRGALFMIDLQEEVEKRGFEVIHIKTDSIKVVDPTPEVSQFIIDFGKAHGYNFEIESQYERICLVNEAVYIAREKEGTWDKDAAKANGWTATGAQFQVPYVFKTLFAKTPLIFDDYTEIKSVTRGGIIYLDMNEDLPDDSDLVKRYEKLEKIQREGKSKDSLVMETEEMTQIRADILKCHAYRFIGKVGKFTPIRPGCHGGQLMVLRNGKYNHVSGTKDYRWQESDIVESTNRSIDIDYTYFQTLADKAKETIEQYGSYEEFVNV